MYRTMGLLRLVGVEDGSFRPFNRRTLGTCLLCAVEMFGPKIEKVKVSPITVDGLDATSKLSEMLRDMDFEAILLGGITFAGFNIINVQQILKEYSRPIIIFIRDRPDNRAVREALEKHFDDWRERWDIIKSLGPVHSTRTRPDEPPIYFEVLGASSQWAEEVLRLSAMLCRIPEPVRVARLIARGLTLRGD
ncbi:DUF99 family protein [Candidatus Bathyarchaeota archaeon]|nr:MAG: DUF99 family protein [Candidatus Bathyarchaeota archaeon]